MVRKLDFIVFGMPRGGTTAVANYLSAVEGVHCGNEVFPVYKSHAKLDIPQAFITPQEGYWNPGSAEIVEANRDRLKIYGNKTPTYFYRLPEILRELDDCPSIACVRNPRDVARSYSMRAGDPKDQWPEGRVGLFAAGDALLLLQSLLAVPETTPVLIVSQNALLADWRGVMQQALAHVAPGTEPTYSPEKLAYIDKRKTQSTRRPKPKLEAPERKAINWLERAGVSEFMSRPEPVILNDVRDEIRQILDQGPKNVVSYIKGMAAEHPNPAVPAHLDRWVRQATRARKLFQAEMEQT